MGLNFIFYPLPLEDLRKCVFFFFLKVYFSFNLRMHVILKSGLHYIENFQIIQIKHHREKDLSQVEWLKWV